MKKIQEKQISDLLARAVNLHQQARLDAAQGCYQQVLRIDHHQPDALHLLGVIAQQQGRTAEAIELIGRAIAVHPARWAFHTNLACAFQESNRFEEAVQSYRRAIELGGESATLLSNLGTAQQAAGRSAEAADCYLRAIELDPVHAEAHYNLGNLQREAGRTSDAIACYEQALRNNPNYTQAHVNLANLLHAQGRTEEAIRRYRWSLEINEHDAETHYNLARALKSVGRFAEALASYERATALKPDHAAAHMFRGLLLLRQGNFAEGWREYEWRWRKPDEVPLRPFPQKLWDGASLADQTLLVYGEQHVSDELMFGTCLPHCIAQAGHCVIECDPRLVPLYARSFPISTVHPREGWDDQSWLAQVRPIDVQTPVGNLPRYYRSDIADFPARRQHLMTDARGVAQWRRRLDALGPGLKIGLCWRATASERRAAERSIPLEHWEPLLTLPDVSFISLQAGDASNEIAAIERRWGIELHDWEDADPARDLDQLAAQMAALDLTVTVDALPAHLAGAVGANVWTLLDYDADWRWLTDRASSVWYPAMRLFRRTAQSDWRGLLAEVGTAVRGGITDQPSAADPRRSSTPPPGATPDLKKRRASITDSRWELQDATIQQAFQRAVGFECSGDIHHAEGIFREILRHAPQQPQTLHRLGRLLKQSGRRDQAIEFLRQAAEVGAANPEFHFDLGVALTEAHRNPEAEQSLRRVIELDPNQAPAYVNLGVICERMDKLDDALTICERGVKLMPQSVQALYNLGNVYLHRGRLADALVMYDRLLAVDPNFSRGHWNRGLACLLLADFAGGWRGYQYREAAEQVTLNKFDLPLWDGSSLAGKTLLVHAEQGVGDEIMFATCLNDVIQQARHVVLTCDPRLEKLIHRSFPMVDVHAVVRGPAFHWTPPPGIDLYTHAGTLPYYLRNRWEDFPRQEKFLIPDPSRVAAWRERFDALGPGPKIGMSWRAGGQSSEQRRRTSLLDHWRPLFEIPNAHFINLQYGDWSADIGAAQARWGVTIHHWPDVDPLTDLETSAAQIAALDAVVSVGNTTIHLAGGVGTPTWTVLPHVPGWRYMIAGESMPWYQTVRLRRQAANRDWDAVFGAVAQEIKQFFSLPAASSAISTSKPAARSSEESLSIEFELHDSAAPSGALPVGKVAEAFLGALKKHRAGRLVEAEEVYRQIVEIDPRHADAWHLLGVIAHQSGRISQAIELTQRAVEVDPDSGVYHYNLAGSLRQAGRVEEAIHHLRRAIELNPHIAEAHLNLGTALHSVGQRTEAIACYERALACRPDYAEAHNNIGSALRDRGRLEQAVQCYHRAIELRPDYNEARANLAAVVRVLERRQQSPLPVPPLSVTESLHNLMPGPAPF